MRHFVLVYDRRAGLVIERRELEDRADALALRFGLDAQFAGDDNIEVTVLSAPSEKHLHATHGRYFKTLEELSF